MRLFYDLHLHSCLSPCGDDEMTPMNIAGMAKILGLDIIALTDHNSVANCNAFFEACEIYGIVPIPGMELTTSEEIHLVCLFSSLEQADEFGRIVKRVLPGIKNRPDIFGRQIIYAPGDIPAGEEELLLINAASLSLENAADTVRSIGGICFPAHIDRDSGGIIAILGDMPPYPRFGLCEISDISKINGYIKKHPLLSGCRFISDSDAHSLETMKEARNAFEISVPAGENSDTIRSGIIEYLRSLSQQ
ncbi:MAG: PHP domain-containing protein [Oscillospiraceae bacterium]|nr:PHP domain-containing protein [Oscillospiraceae bacterium]